MNDTTGEQTAAGLQAAPATSAPNAAQAAPLPPSSRRAAAQLTAFVALILAVLALGLLALHWHSSRGALKSLRLEVAKRLADAEAVNKESRLIAEQAREASADAQVKLGVLEQRLAESQSQQIALESLYQDLSRNRDESAFAEIEQSLLIASQQLQLAGNVKAALIALQNADTRLQRMDRPQFTPLRKAIARDIDRLQALPYVDVVGVSLRLDNVIAAVDRLPLAMEVRPADTAMPEAPKPMEPSAWNRFWQEAWSELKQLVRVQHMDQPEVPLLAPSQGFFLRENLKLRLLGARLALLSRDQTSYKADLQAAHDWIVKYYDTREKSVGSVLATLRNLQESDINIEMPDISGTLDSLRNLRLARDRGPR
jgi:uroporphyrin-3 C-methyltransferase